MALKDLFALAGTITVDNSGAIKNIDKATDHAKQSESKFERSFQTIKNLAVTYLSTTAIFNFGKSMVEAAANVQAETAQFDAAFKDLSGSASEAFARLEESTGTLATRLQVTGTKAFSQFTGSGMESTEALKQMESYLSLATDGAAYYDMSLEEVDERLRSFLRGNTEAGDAIGLFTSEKQRDQKANEMYGKSFIKLSEDQKQLVMLDITKSIYDASGATGQAAREADGYANVVGNLKEQWRQFLAQIGTPILEAIIPILQSLGGLLEKMSPVLTTITEFVAKVFTFLSENVWLLEAIGAGLIAIATAYGIWTVATNAQAWAQKALNAVMAASPITWIVLGIGLVVAALVTLYNKSDSFRAFWDKTWAKIKDVAQKAWEAIKKVWEVVKPFFTALWNSIKFAAQTAWEIIKTVFVSAWIAVKGAWQNSIAFFQMIWNTIKNIFSVVKSVLTGDFKGAWQGIKNIFSGVGAFFRSVVSNAVNAFKGIGSKIANMFSGVGAKIKEKITSGLGKIGSGVKKLLGFRTGGVFTGESAIRVAEYPNATTNPEIVTPQNIMRGTFEDTLNEYALKLQGGGDNAKVISLLEQIIGLFGQQKVVLSTGELVGAITPRIDKSLGERSDKKARGRV